MAAIVAAESRRTRAFTAALGAVGELKTREAVEIAVEARWTFRRAVAVDGEIGIGSEEGVGSDEGLLRSQPEVCEGARQYQQRRQRRCAA